MRLNVDKPCQGSGNSNDLPSLLLAQYADTLQLDDFLRTTNALQKLQELTRILLKDSI